MIRIHTNKIGDFLPKNNINENVLRLAFDFLFYDDNLSEESIDKHAAIFLIDNISDKDLLREFIRAKANVYYHDPKDTIFKVRTKLADADNGFHYIQVFRDSTNKIVGFRNLRLNKSIHIFKPPYNSQTFAGYNFDVVLISEMSVIEKSLFYEILVRLGRKSNNQFQLNAFTELSLEDFKESELGGLVHANIANLTVY